MVMFAMNSLKYFRVGLVVSLFLVSSVFIVAHNSLISGNELQQSDWYHRQMMSLSSHFALTRREKVAEFDNASYWSEVQQPRLDLMNSVCLEMKTKLGSWKHHLNSYLAGPRRKLAYCHVPKVASTWWMAAFAKSFKIHDDDIKKMEHKMVLHGHILKNAVKSSSLPDSSFKFVFIRDPIDRIVSAFINKFIVVKEKGFVYELVKFSRQVLEIDDSKEDPITFPNFVEFILQENKRQKVSYGTYHWVPYFQLCNFCDTSINFLGKLETFSEDVSYLKVNFPYMSPYLNISNPRNFVKSSIEYDSYWNQLSPKHKEQVCEMYKWDFKLFGYECR